MTWRGVRTLSAIVALSVASLVALPAVAQTRRVEIGFRARRRAQIAIWIESSDGSRFATIRLTEAVSFRGIGNRPGALMMNSGRHWPYGRREGALPIWSHRRYDYEGDAFRRVIFDRRRSEGDASTASSIGEPPNTRDEYFCLSFEAANNDIELGEDAFDTMTCASVFLSAKGRYITPADVAVGYSEPWEDAPGMGTRRMLSLESLYPPRRDLVCPSGLCGNSEDARNYAADALEVMPELDAIGMATPAEGAPVSVPWDVPEEWPDGDYRIFVEVNAEGDYAPGWDAAAHPTPRMPAGAWDSWAMSTGYAYRGQPSVLYEVPITIGPAGGAFTGSEPSGYGALHGEHGDVVPMDGSIRNDHAAHPGSGGDRLFADADGARVTVRVPPTDVCAQDDPPVECGQECNATRPCMGEDLVCGPTFACVDRCLVSARLGLPGDVTLEPWTEYRHTHEWVTLRFTVPEVERGPIGRFEVRVGTDPIVDLATFVSARPARRATAGSEALTIPTTHEDGSPLLPGDVIELALGGLSPETVYHVGVRAFDDCGVGGDVASAEITTTAIQFTTVSPCFVATAAYGSPLEPRIGVLRRFRDRELLPLAGGRALVAVYETVGPWLAGLLEDAPTARAAVRAGLEPIVSVLETIDPLTAPPRR